VSAPDMEDLLRAAEMACQAAIRAGADFADAAAERGQTLSISVERNAIKSSDARRWGAVSVRAFKAGGTGWSSFSGISEEAAARAGRQAGELAQAAEPDPDFVDLVSPGTYPEVAGLFDPALAGISGADMVAWATGNIDSARAVAPEALVSGGARTTWREWALVNSAGVRAHQRSTSASVSAGVVVRRGDDVGAYHEWDAARSRFDLEPEGLGAKAAEEALRYLQSRTMGTATLPVVFGPLAGRALLDGLCSAASAEEVQRNRSYLIGKQDEQVASEDVTLLDDPLIPGGLS